MTTELSHQSINTEHSNDRTKVPTEIIYHRASRLLELIYPDKSTSKISSEFLRVHSPSAEVRGHTPDQATLQYEKKNVAIVQIVLQGSYAIRISFDDNHDTGVYTWHYLWELSENQTIYWEEYLQALLKSGKSR
ncbi:MAG: DUF971 family protein [Pseudohongiellaceae bacterium]|jgi:DUF971 family protein